MKKMNGQDHPKVYAALQRYGEQRFVSDAQSILDEHPRCRIVLGLLGGPSVACNPNARFWSHTAGKRYPRPAVRYVRGYGIVGISFHAGPYLCISL
jgi:hypothetical protein